MVSVLVPRAKRAKSHAIPASWRLAASPPLGIQSALPPAWTTGSVACSWSGTCPPPSSPWPPHRTAPVHHHALPRDPALLRLRTFRSGGVAAATPL